MYLQIKKDQPHNIIKVNEFLKILILNKTSEFSINKTVN